MHHVGCMTVLNLTWFRAHPPPSKGEGIICCYYKRFSYPLRHVWVTVSPPGEGRPLIPPAELGGIPAYFDKPQSPITKCQSQNNCTSFKHQFEYCYWGFQITWLLAFDVWNGYESVLIPVHGMALYFLIPRRRIGQVFLRIFKRQIMLILNP